MIASPQVFFQPLLRQSPTVLNCWALRQHGLACSEYACRKGLWKNINKINADVAGLAALSSVPPARAFDFVGLKKDEVPLREGGACRNVHDDAGWISDSSYRLPSSFMRARLKLKGDPPSCHPRRKAYRKPE